MNKSKSISFSRAPRCSEGGYTLVEMAIALMVLGLIIAGFFQAYAIYMRQQQVRVTNENIALAIGELQRFKQLNGFYPCPAPISAPRNDEFYGAPTDCTDGVPTGTIPASGASGVNGRDGVGVALSARLVTPSSGAPYNPRVRIGAIPFRVLDLDEKASYDGYGSRLVYALTENMASLNTFNALEGGIGIVDASSAAGASAIDPPDSGLFAITSMGRDKVGAYDRQGNAFGGCDAATAEGQNCDFGTNATFRTALESNGVNSYDDRISFFASQDDVLWVRLSAPNQDDIVDLSAENIGVGSLNPQAKLDIKDSSGSVDETGTPNPEGTLRATGNVETQKVCPSTYGNLNGDNNCFDPINIAGDNATNPANNTPGSGMKCPAGTYMNGIQDGRAICSPVALRCTSAVRYMRGITADGQADCAVLPCGTQDVTICGSARTLNSGVYNSYQTITGGTSRTQTYQCRINNAQTAMNWVQSSASGNCNCTPSSVTTGNIPCGAGYSGTYSSTTVTVCPSGNTTTTNTRGVDCTCIAQPPQNRNRACPSNTNSGAITETRNWICTGATGAWGPWTQTSNTCTCVAPVPSTQTVIAGECPDGYDGVIQQAQTFNTTICGWENDGPPTNTCTCDSSETREILEDPACGPSEHVTQQAVFRQTRDGADCTWGTRVEVEPGTCAPNTYKWQIVASPGGSPVNGRVGPLVMQSCTYSDYLSGSTRTCSQNLSGNLYMIHECQCKP